MVPQSLKDRLQPTLAQDLDAIWHEWAMEVEHADPAAFVEHLAAWSLVDAATAAELLRFLAGPVVGRIDDESDEGDAEAATLHYASWSDPDETSDPEDETHLHNPLLSFDDTSEEALPSPLEEPDPSGMPDRRERPHRLLGGVRDASPSDDLAAPQDPSGRYRFVDVSGEGATSRVYRAEDHRLHRIVAYKAMSSEVARQPELATKFTAGAQITAQLDHPGIVPVYDLASERAYTMKLVEGQTLRQLLDEASQTRRVRRDHLLDVLARVCDAVAYAHSRGVIHRDLKPENIMVGAFGAVYVMDWGIAKVFDASVARPVAATAGADEGDLVIGTPGHMSPEQAEGHNLGLYGASDQYALGLLLFEILTLSPAVTAKTSRAMVVRQREGELDPLVHRFADRIPREVRAIAKKALQTDPARRYPSVAELAADLRRHLAGEAVVAHHDNLLQRSARWLSRHGERALLLLGLLLLSTVLVSLGGAGVLWWQHATAQAREQRLTTVLTTAARQASLVEGQFLRLEGLLSVVSTAAGESLRTSADEEPRASTLYVSSVFRDAATAPQDADERSASERYGPGLVSARHPAFVLPVGTRADPRWEALADGARRHLPRVLLRSHSEQRATVTEALARQTILDREIPVMWAWVGLEDGLYLSYPGHGGYPDDLDPRALPAYLRAHDQQAPVWGPVESHPSGRGEVVTVSQALLDDESVMLGAAGLDVSLDWLVDKVLLPKSLQGASGVAALLLDGDGNVIVTTGPQGCSSIREMNQVNNSLAKSVVPGKIFVQRSLK